MRFKKFEGWEFDLTNDELIVKGSAKELSVTQSRVLKLLIEKVGQDVLRDELMALWPNLVDSNNLDTAIKGIRQAFQELGLNPKEIIKTEHGKGYRLVAYPVAADGEFDEALSTKSKKPMPVSAKLLAAAGFMVILLTICIAVWHYRTTRRDKIIEKPLPTPEQLQQACQAEPIRVVIATLDAEDEQKYKVTDVIRSNIREAFKDDPKVVIDYLGRPIRETKNGDDPAQILKGQRASLLIWGFYVKTTDKIAVTLNLQADNSINLFLPNKMAPIYPGKALDHLEVHQDLSSSLTNLSRLVVAMVRMTQGDPKSASQLFTAVLRDRHLPKNFVNPGLIYINAGLAEFRLGNARQGTHLWTQALPLISDDDLQKFFSWFLPMMSGEAVSCPYPYRTIWSDGSDMTAWINVVCNLSLAGSTSGTEAAGYLDSALKNLQLVPEDSTRYSLEATVFEQKGDLEKALASSNRAIRSSSCDAFLYWARGHIWELKNNVPSAMQDYSISTTLAPWNQHALVSIGILLRNQHNLDAALVKFRRALEISRDPSLYTFILSIYLAKARESKNNDQPRATILALYAAAAAEAQKWIRLDQTSVDAHKDLARIYEESEKWEFAAREYRSALVQAHGTSTDLYQALACVLTRLDKLSEARTLLVEALRRNRSDFHSFDCLSQFYREQNLIFAAIVAKRKAIDLFVANSQQSALDAEEERYRKTMLGYLYQDLSDLYQHAGYLDLALGQLDIAEKFVPTQELLYYRRAQIHIAMGQLKEARNDYSQGLILLPHSAALYYGRARVELQLKQFRDARNDLEMAISINPKNSLAYTVRTEIDILDGNVDNARSDYAMAINIDPDWTHYSNRMYFLVEHKLFKEALDDAKKLITFQPRNADAHEAAGQCYGRLGYVKLALAEFHKAHQLRQADSTAAAEDVRNRGCALSNRSDGARCATILATPWIARDRHQRPAF